MTVATELQNLNDNLLDAYDAVAAKSGTVPANKNTDNLADAITNIPAGGADIDTEIRSNITNELTASTYLGNILPEDLEINIASTVTSINLDSTTYRHDIFWNGKKIKFTGGSTSLAYFKGMCRGRNISNTEFGPVEVDMSELSVSNSGFRPEDLCIHNKRVTKVVFPAQRVSTFTPLAAFQDSSVRIVDFGGMICVSTEAGACFYQAYSVEKIIIRNDTGVFKVVANTFQNSSISAGTCLIYVPDALVNDYKADSQWSTYEAQIKPLSELVE